MKTIIITTFLFVFMNCFMFDKTVEINQAFILKKNETAQIKDTNLRLKMLSNGHSFGESGDVPMCEFESVFNNKTEKRTLNIGKSAVFGNLSVKLQSVDTTADPKATDPWSATSCGFIVTKNRK